MSEPGQFRTGLEALVAEIKKPGSGALLFLSLTLTLVAIFVLPDWKVPAAWPATVLVLLMAYIWLSGATIHNAVATSRGLAARLMDMQANPDTHLPKVVKAMKAAGPDGELILLLLPNRLFGQSMLVSIYYENERGFEILMAKGEVGNIQTNGSIQVLIREWEEPHESIRQRIIEQDIAAISRLIVRPAPSIVTNSVNMDSAFLSLVADRISRTLTNG